MPTIEEFDQIDREAHLVHDRAAAILLVAQVERFLEMAIIGRLARRDETTVDTLVTRDGPLSTFSAKIRLAYAMRIIEDIERDDLDKIREIRNLFAHAMRPVTFNSDAVVMRIAALKSAQGHPPEDLEPLSPLAAALLGRSDNPNRLRFIVACRKLSSMILTGLAATIAS
jgi:DNA-binding MltR family transcriptional regulator